MRTAVPFSPQFMEGFVDQCHRLGFDANGTEEMFRKFASNYYISQPNVFQGFSTALAKYEGPITKAAMAKYLTPEMMTLAIECRIKYGSDMLSQQMRAEMGLPEPSWDTVPETVKQAASSLSSVLDNFDRLPLNQKIMLASLTGAGMGTASRLVAPTAEDEMAQRGAFSRASRGAIRGAGTGAGVAAGAAAGSNMGGMVNPGFRLPALAMGSVFGGMAGNRLVSDFVR